MMKEAIMVKIMIIYSHLVKEVVQYIVKLLIFVNHQKLLFVLMNINQDCLYHLKIQVAVILECYYLMSLNKSKGFQKII